VLAVKALSKRFGGFLAVNQVSFEVRQGEILGLIGPNGSGKSTIFNLIAGALRPSSGSIVFAGAELAGQPAHVVCRRGVARTFQIPRPFRKLSLLDNVTLAAFYGVGGALSRSEAQRRAAVALDQVGLPSDPATGTDGLGAAALKKLELARALATQPKLLLLDEAMSGLTPIEAAAAMQLVRRIHEELKVTMCVVEHVMEVVMPLSHRVVVLDYGVKIADGTPQAIVRDEQVIRAYLGERRAAH
jgi:branched-chain amino acid transport system ATP-binding protein